MTRLPLTQRRSTDASNRAVSPVIGVILMVAITVILAAVIGAFVLEIGDQQETAPSTSFDSEQQTKFFCDGAGTPAKANLSVVEITHAGGSVIDTNSADIKVNGNDSAYGHWAATSCGTNDWIRPQPNFIANLGTNDPEEFSSGETWNVVIHSGPSRETYEGLSDHQTRTVNGETGPAIELLYESGADRPRSSNFAVNIKGNSAAGQFTGSPNGPVTKLAQGDNTNVVWTASSGGKTQTIFKYTLQ